MNNSHLEKIKNLVDRACTPTIGTLGSSYRFQFKPKFTFDHALQLVPYLKELGITHVYFSPILKASAGSTHCYDVVDHTIISEELGGAVAFNTLVAALRANSIGFLIDVVPNTWVLRRMKILGGTMS